MNNVFVEQSIGIANYSLNNMGSYDATPTQACTPKWAVKNAHHDTFNPAGFDFPPFRSKPLRKFPERESSVPDGKRRSHL